MIFAIVAIFIVILLGFSLGVALVVGAIRHWKVLFDPPDARYVPSFWLARKFFGEKYLFVNYLLGGIVIICIALFGAIKVIHDLVVGF